MLHRCHWTLRNGIGRMARDPAYDGRSAKLSSATLKRSPAAPRHDGSSCPRLDLADTGRASVGLALGRCNYEAGAWKMHTDLADGEIAASDDDLMDARGDQFADDRISSGIVRSNADDLPRLPSDGIFRGSRCFRD